MLERHSVRRDPRVLLLRPAGSRIEFATLDAWEVLAVGEIAMSRLPGTLRLALGRRVRQVRPTVVLLLAHAPRIERVLSSVLSPIGVPLKILTASERRSVVAARPSLDALSAEYPELLIVGESPRGQETLCLAAAAFLTLTFPTRLYAPTVALRATARLDTRGARRPGTPSVSVGPAALRRPPADGPGDRSGA